ncbi:MAG: hypothetical protein ACK5XF_03855 [Neisseriaceae bacterium]
MKIHFSSKMGSYKLFGFIITCLTINVCMASKKQLVSSIAEPTAYEPIIYSGINYKFNNPDQIAIDSNDNVWVGNSDPNKRIYLVKIPKNAPTQPEHYASKLSGFSQEITVDYKNNIWLANIGDMYAGAAVEEFPVNNPNNPIVYTEAKYNFSSNYGIASDRTGNIWVSSQSLTASPGSITEIPINNPNEPIIYLGEKYHFDQPLAITSDPQGNIWVANQGYFGDASIIKFPATNPNNPIIYSGSKYGIELPTSIISDSKGNIWFSSLSNATVTEIPVNNPDEPIIYSVPYETYKMTADNEDNIWMTTQQSQIFEIPATKPNTVVTYSGEKYGFGNTLGIKADSQGNIWVVNGVDNTITELKKINTVK